MLGFLGELEAVTTITSSSLYLPPGLSPSELENSLTKLPGLQAFPEDLPKLAQNSATGAVVFWGSPRKCLVFPPFPLREKYFAQGYDVEPLRSLLQHDFKIALVLVRLGAYAIGLCQGESLISSKVGTGLVHGRHKKGGSSQHRFERHREKQIEYFLTRVCIHAREHLEPGARTVDYMVYGGARTTILLLQKRCPFLGQFDHRTLPPLLDIPDPRQAVLEAAVGQAWSSKLTEWYDNET